MYTVNTNFSSILTFQSLQKDQTGKYVCMVTRSRDNSMSTVTVYGTVCVPIRGCGVPIRGVVFQSGGVVFPSGMYRTRYHQGCVACVGHQRHIHSGLCNPSNSLYNLLGYQYARNCNHSTLGDELYCIPYMVSQS